MFECGEAEDGAKCWSSGAKKDALVQAASRVSTTTAAFCSIGGGREPSKHTHLPLYGATPFFIFSFSFLSASYRGIEAILATAQDGSTARASSLLAPALHDRRSSKTVFVFEVSSCKKTNSARQILRKGKAEEIRLKKIGKGDRKIKDKDRRRG